MIPTEAELLIESINVGNVLIGHEIGKTVFSGQIQRR
jgi:hypothetical protein